MRILSALWIARTPVLAFMVIGVFWGTFAAAVPDIKDRLGVNDAVFGVLLLGNATGLVTAMWLAPVLDRVFGERGLQFSVAVFAATILLPAFAPSPLTFFLSLTVLGLFSGLTDILMNARVSELEAQHNRTLMNSSHGMFSVAYAISALVTGFLRDAGQPPEVALCLAALVIFIIAIWLRMPVGFVADDGDTSMSGMPWIIVLTCGGIVLAAFMTEATVETWSALHIERTLDGDPLAGSIGPFMLGLTMAIGRLGGQGLSDRYPDHNVVICASLLAAFGAWTAAAAQTPALAYLGFGILGLGVSVIGPLGIAMAGRLVPARHRTEAISKVAVMGFSGFFIAPVFMGVISEYTSLRIAYGVIGCFVLLAIVLVLRLPRR